MEKNSTAQVYVFDSAPAGTNLIVRHTSRLRSLEDECFGLYDENMKNMLKSKRAEIKKPGSGQFDGMLLSLDSFSLQKGKRILEVIDMHYSTYQTLKEQLNKELGYEHSLTRCVPLIAFTETKEGDFIFGHRAGNHMSGLYLPPAGFSDHEGKVSENYFSELSVNEIEEELGIKIKEEDVHYAGLSAGEDSRNITVVTNSVLPYSKKEVEEIFTELKERLRKEGRKIEHKHLIYVPGYPRTIGSFLCGEYTGSLNLIRDIYFEKGNCVKGPQEILNKKYGQIGNGIGGVLAIMKQRLSKKEYSQLVNQIESSGVTPKVEHTSLEEKFNL